MKFLISTLFGKILYSAVLNGTESINNQLKAENVPKTTIHFTTSKLKNLLNFAEILKKAPAPTTTTATTTTATRVPPDGLP